MLLLARSLSGSAAHEEVSLTELAEKPCASTSEPLFGIAPRKLRNVEDEDFVSTSTSTSTSPHHPSPAAHHHNYFSQTWAEQKHRPLLNSSDDELVSPGPSVRASLRQQSQRPAPNRVWLVAPDWQASTQETFTFASFKVLASEVAHRHRRLFMHVPYGMLDWKSRSRKILAGLELCSADIICLQVVDRFSDLQSELSSKGYAGLYKASTGTQTHSCAIFWRQERFQLLHEENLEFSLLGMRDNVAQLCVLQSTVPGTPNMGATSNSGNLGPSQSKRLIVGNIDILFNPKRGHIKLGQCRAFLQQAHKLSSLWPDAPLIIGGCFNLTPQSAVYDFLVNSKLDVHGLEDRYLSGQVLMPSNPARGGAKHLGTNMTSSGKGELSLDLRNRLRKSLVAKFASKQETHALDFANSAKEVLSSTTSIGRSSTILSDNKHTHKNEGTPAKKIVSKTIEILESCINSQPSSRCMANTVTEVDVAPSSSKGMDTRTLSVNAYTSSELVAHFGSKMELSSESCSETPEQKSLNGFDGVSTEACTASSSTCVEVLCDIAAPVSTIPTDIAKANDDQCTAADPPGQSTPDHHWDPEELKLATGFANSTVVKHELKLFSVYPEIQGNSKTRDDKGEPDVTMCHREFRGTVDYIWRSEGLKTVKVLDTFSLTDILATPALPFMACGSDHIYLACELAFTSH